MWWGGGGVRGRPMAWEILTMSEGQRYEILGVPWKREGGGGVMG